MLYVKPPHQLWYSLTRQSKHQFRNAIKKPGAGNVNTGKYFQYWLHLGSPTSLPVVSSSLGCPCFNRLDIALCISLHYSHSITGSKGAAAYQLGNTSSCMVTEVKQHQSAAANP